MASAPMLDIQFAPLPQSREMIEDLLSYRRPHSASVHF